MTNATKSATGGVSVRGARRFQNELSGGESAPGSTGSRTGVPQAQEAFGFQSSRAAKSREASPPLQGLQDEAEPWHLDGTIEWVPLRSTPLDNRTRVELAASHLLKAIARLSDRLIRSRLFSGARVRRILCFR